MCRRTRHELGVLAEAFADRRKPLQDQRAALRRGFKAGEFTQREYQGRLKVWREQAERLDRERPGAEAAARGRFAARLEGRGGRAVSLGEAERLLTEVALVVEVGRP